LIVAQVALAVVLLFSAGLLLQTFAGLLGIDRGYDVDEVLTLSTSLPTAAYPDFSSRTALYDRVLERVDGLPEVESSALSSLLPYHGWSRAAVRIDGYTPQDDEQMMAEYLVVTPQFFGTVGIPPLSGRLFTERDDDVVVINQTMARTYWPDGNPLGARVTLGPFGMVTVIGVVNDTRYTRLDAAESPQAYVPYRSGDAMDMMLFIRSAGDPRELIVPIRQIFAATDREIAVADIMTIRERLWHTTANERFRAVLLGTFGATALLLAMVGVYGVIAYNVGQRTRELGIRKALGADSGLILRRVVGGGLGLVALGSLIGAAGCWYVATLLEAYLFGVEARDPWAFAAATLALAAAALAAAWIPARRAAAVDPLVALRAE
jgi:predicted permease